MMPAILALLIVVLAQPVSAQMGSCVNIGGGFTTCSDNTGRQATIVDMGNGFRSYSDSKGNSGSIVDMGGGFQSFNIMPGTPPAAPPPVFAPRSMPQFSPMPGMSGVQGVPAPMAPFAPTAPMMPQPFGMR